MYCCSFFPATTASPVQLTERGAEIIAKTLRRRCPQLPWSRPSITGSIDHTASADLRAMTSKFSPDCRWGMSSLPGRKGLLPGNLSVRIRAVSQKPIHAQYQRIRTGVSTIRIIRREPTEPRRSLDPAWHARGR
jgi:hypothetical protein